LVVETSNDSSKDKLYSATRVETRRQKSTRQQNKVTSILQSKEFTSSPSGIEERIFVINQFSPKPNQLTSVFDSPICTIRTIAALLNVSLLIKTNRLGKTCSLQILKKLFAPPVQLFFSPQRQPGPLPARSNPSVGSTPTQGPCVYQCRFNRQGLFKHSCHTG